MIFVARKAPDGSGDVVFEDDGRCGYLYWHGPAALPKVESHVWLYNRLPAPDRFERDPGGGAPLNRADMVDADAHEAFVPPEGEDDVSLRFTDDGAVEVLIHGARIGRLTPDESPGAALFAARSGPAANPLGPGRPTVRREPPE